MRPITVCVLGVWAAGTLSQLGAGQIGLAIDFAAGFGKVMLYYLLLVSVLDTPNRLRAFLGWIVAFVVLITALALLQYHGVIDMDTLKPMARKDYGANQEEENVILQLRATGIYNDPNDLCLLLVCGSLCALYRSVNTSGPIGRLLWLSPIALFGYAVTLTQSRGGLLGLGLAFATWAHGRFGWKRTLLLLVALSPTVLLLGGRQANMNFDKGDTAHERVELWANGLFALMQNPVTGIGVGRYGEEMGLVAHNSFVHAYVEMGFLGGTLFLGAFFLGALGLHRTKPGPNGRLALLRLFVLAIVVGYAGGIFSLSRNYMQQTYMTLGLAEVTLRLMRTNCPDWYRFDKRVIGGLAVLGLMSLIALKIFTNILVK